MSVIWLLSQFGYHPQKAVAEEGARGEGASDLGVVRPAPLGRSLLQPVGPLQYGPPRYAHLHCRSAPEPAAADCYSVMLTVAA